jgi:hypothetical protein
MTLPTRKIGNDDISAIGFGAMGIGGAAYGEAGSDEERFKVHRFRVTLQSSTHCRRVFLRHRSLINLLNSAAPFGIPLMFMYVLAPRYVVLTPVFINY